MIGVAASGVIFGLTRYFAGGHPRTMTKEYEEATNEYFKVSLGSTIRAAEAPLDRILMPRANRRTRSSPSLATAAKATRGRAKCSRRLDPKSDRTIFNRLPHRPQLFLEHLHEMCREDRRATITGWKGGFCILRQAFVGIVQSSTVENNPKLYRRLPIKR